MKRQKMEQVKIGGRRTPAVVTSRGPKVSAARIAQFERHLGYSLPPDYREFLLKYNGGDPAVGEVRGRDDRPDVPYQHGDSIRTFLKLSCREGDVSQYEELRAPVEIPWSLPKNLLPIAEDAGGNCFILELGQKGGCVRFLDHEALDEEITHHRVV